jgi:hypothetical protein
MPGRAGQAEPVPETRVCTTGVTIRPAQTEPSATATRHRGGHRLARATRTDGAYSRGAILPRRHLPPKEQRLARGPCFDGGVAPLCAPPSAVSKTARP